jgi:hypothetical protein
VRPSRCDRGRDSSCMCDLALWFSVYVKCHEEFCFSPVRPAMPTQSVACDTLFGLLVTVVSCCAGWLQRLKPRLLQRIVDKYAMDQVRKHALLLPPTNNCCTSHLLPLLCHGCGLPILC